jgi:hypothetical protein
LSRNMRQPGRLAKRGGFTAVQKMSPILFLP